MSKKDDNSVEKKGNREKTPASVTTVWLFLIIAILVLIGSFFGYSYFTEISVLKNKELMLWFLFMLFAAGITCTLGAITSHFSQKSEENRERIMVQEIKNEIKIALEQSDVVSGDQDLILNILMDHCSAIGEKIKKIRISAYNSDTFFKFFVTYFKNKQSLECEKLMILMHNQDEKETGKIADGWISLIKGKIDSHEIRRAKTDRRSFFGMTIEFESYHSIGLIGFYKPQDADNRNEVIPNSFEKRYGVFSKRSSILDVLDEYFNYYFNDNHSKLLKEEPKKTS